MSEIGDKPLLAAESWAQQDLRAIGPEQRCLQAQASRGLASRVCYCFPSKPVGLVSHFAEPPGFSNLTSQRGREGRCSSETPLGWQV